MELKKSKTVLGLMLLLLILGMSQVVSAHEENSPESDPCPGAFGPRGGEHDFSILKAAVSEASPSIEELDWRPQLEDAKAKLRAANLARLRRDLMKKAGVIWSGRRQREELELAGEPVVDFKVSDGSKNHLYLGPTQDAFVSLLRAEEVAQTKAAPLRDRASLRAEIQRLMQLVEKVQGSRIESLLALKVVLREVNLYRDSLHEHQEVGEVGEEDPSALGVLSPDVVYKSRPSDNGTVFQLHAQHFDIEVYPKKSARSGLKGYETFIKWNIRGLVFSTSGLDVAQRGGPDLDEAYATISNGPAPPEVFWDFWIELALSHLNETQLRLGQDFENLQALMGDLQLMAWPNRSRGRILNALRGCLGSGDSADTIRELPEEELE